MQGQVGLAVDLLRANGLNDDQVQAEINEVAAIVREQKLKDKGYTEEEVNYITGAGSDERKDWLESIIARISIHWKRRAEIYPTIESMQAKAKHAIPTARLTMERLIISVRGGPEYLLEKEMDMQSIQKEDVTMSQKSDPELFTHNGIRSVVRASLITAGFLMLLFPPWTNTFSRPGAAVSKSPAGYGFLFSPPEPENEGPVFGVELDLKRLMLQVVLLGGAFGLLAYTNKRKEPIKDH